MTPDSLKVLEKYIDRSVGISRRKLNIRAAIGIIIFGWLMKMNYDDLGHNKLGWVFLAVIIALLSVARQVKPRVGYLAPIIYVAAWVHANTILSKKQLIAKKQYLAEKRRY